MKTEAAAKSGFWWPLICSGSGSGFGVLLLESWHLVQDCFLFIYFCLIVSLVLLLWVYFCISVVLPRISLVFGFRFQFLLCFCLLVLRSLVCLWFLLFRRSVESDSLFFKASMGCGFSVPDFWSSPGLWFPHLIEVVSVLFNLCFVLRFKVPAKWTRC